MALCKQWWLWKSEWRTWYIYMLIFVFWFSIPQSCLHLHPFKIEETLFIKDIVLMVWGSFIHVSFLYKWFIKCKTLSIHKCPISVCSFFDWSFHLVVLITYMLLLFMLSDELHYHPWLVCCTHHTVPNLTNFYSTFSTFRCCLMLGFYPLYVGHLESKERLRIQPAQLFNFSWWVMWCVQ